MFDDQTLLKIENWSKPLVDLGTNYIIFFRKSSLRLCNIKKKSDLLLGVRVPGKRPSGSTLEMFEPLN